MADNLFFIASKIFWLFFSPDILLVLLFVICLFLFWIKATKKALILLHILIIFCVITTFFPVGKWMLVPLETQFSTPDPMPETIDGVIVLAGAENLELSKEWSAAQLGDACERYIAFIDLMNRYPDSKHVFTGGIGSLSERQMDSADVAKLVFKELHIDTTHIVFENKARNTYENAVLTKKIISPRPGEKWILITSASHMPRSVGIFQKIGWPVIPYPVDYRTHKTRPFQYSVNFSNNLSYLNGAFREWIGLTAYYLTGKTESFLPKADTSG